MAAIIFLLLISACLLWAGISLRNFARTQTPNLRKSKMPEKQEKPDFINEIDNYLGPVAVEKGWYAFYIKGSGSNIYRVEMRRIGVNLTVVCSCKAGDNWKHCKHRINLLFGDLTDLLWGQDNLKYVKSLLEGTDVEKALIEYAENEDKSSKKALAKAFHD